MIIVKFLLYNLEIKGFYVTIIVLNGITRKVEELMVCGKLEIDILNSFWNLTMDNEDMDISIQDIVDELSRNGVERAYTTIKTVMDRLTVKSILVRYKVGKKFFYKATMNKKEMALESLNTFVDQFFEGEHVNLMRFMENECNHLLV